jgi:pimeloyl-ACP methyl ester carboxylesterase
MKQLTSLLVLFITLSCGHKRTQEPKEPLPYASEEVTFKSLQGDITLHGTFTTPKDSLAQKAVILITGSGPQDRDYTNQFDHRPFLVLSHYLTERGIAVLRYDERGVGESDGDYKKATHEDLVSDAAGGISFLRQHGFKQIGIIGHSQGGGIAPLADQQQKVDFIVSMAGVGVTADKILSYNTNHRLEKMGIDESMRNEIVATIDSLLSILKKEPDTGVARRKMEEFMTAKERTASSQYKEVAGRLGNPQALIDAWLDPKFIYSLHNDPLVDWRKVRVPVLMLYGDDDGTIDINKRRPDFELALDSTEHEIKIFNGLGHLFMNKNELPMHKIKEVEETIAPEVLEFIYTWINLR